MKLNTTIKTLCAAVAFATSAAASAGPMFFDIGIEFAPTESGAGSATSTAIKDYMVFNYYSQTQLTGPNTFTTYFGTDASGTVNGGLAKNSVTSFDPGYAYPFGVNTTNMYNMGATWLLSFGGYVSGTYTTPGGPGTLPVLTFTSGNLDLFAITYTGPGGAPVFNNFMDIKITGGSTVPGNSYLDGLAVFDAAQASDPLRNLIHTGGNVPACSASSGLYDIVTGCGAAAPVYFHTNLNTSDADISQLDQGIIKGHHDGSASFDVPEPASLALLGAGLFGLGAIRRRKSA